MDDKDPSIKHRYFVTDAEVKLLRDNTPIYFGFGFRSQDRKDLIKKVFEELKKINVEWTEKKVRVWFINHGNKYGHDSISSDTNKPETTLQLLPPKVSTPTHLIQPPIQIFDAPSHSAATSEVIHTYKADLEEEEEE
jgi:hypothetical protein